MYGCAHTLNRLFLYRSDLVFSAGNEPVFFVIWNRQNFFSLFLPWVIKIKIFLISYILYRFLGMYCKLRNLLDG